jgi:hypothetical protein
MPSNYKTPGVYIEEQNAFPNGAVAVPTAVPVFIGYTEKASHNGKALKGIPIRITSIEEYVEYFGKDYRHQFTLAAGSLNPFNAALLFSPEQRFYFYNSIRLFYLNGGANCYILCVGTYSDTSDEPLTSEIKSADFSDEVFTILAKEFEPAIVVVPDIISTVKNNPTECYEVYKRVLKHCHDAQSRFAIFDVYCDDIKTDIQNFRENIGIDYLNYGAAYYPWLNASVVTAGEINLHNLNCQPGQLKTQLPEPAVAAIFAQWVAPADTDTAEQKETSYQQLHQALLTGSAVYHQIMDEIKVRLNLLPPGGAMAGIYTLVDTSRGVWKAPANVSLSGVNSPSINISHDQQEDINVDVMTGKSINAIRPFPGVGTLVWGARTLDGNSQDWRYINVRRTMIMIEQSLKLACRAYVFEPNDSSTWITIKSMMENFLYNLWKQGALAGSVPEQAYSVKIGPDITMTAADILNGYLTAVISLAIVRPAEFIVLTFQQQQQV